jgi:hypothetical protein
MTVNKPTKRKTPKVIKMKRARESVLPEEVEVVEEVLAPEYKKPFTLLVAIATAIALVMYGSHLIGDMVDARAKAAWSTEYAEGKAKHEAIDLILKTHEDRISSLERQGQEVRGMLIEIKAGVQTQVEDVKTIKADLREIQQTKRR